ncbi:MAG TPA: UMP kinase [bacterium]|nr:UMP kinase [bacterium]
MPKLSLDPQDPLILSVGGSLIVPNGGPDIDFLKALRALALKIVERGTKLVIVTGGGKTARHYIDAAAGVQAVADDDLDWLGIHATRLNGHLVRTVLRDVAHPVVYKNPLAVPPVAEWRGSVLIGAGWRPGWSTDFVACRIAQILDAKTIINLSNIDFVYDLDPREHADAAPQENMRWRDYRKLVGDVWSPGLSAPFDPVAAKFCHKYGMSVAVVNGGKFERVEDTLFGKEFVGSLLS